MVSRDSDAIVLQLRELIAVNREQIAEMKALGAQMQKDNAEFRAQMFKDNAEFRAQITKDNAEFRAQITKENSEFREQITNAFVALKEETRREFDKVHTEIAILQSDIRVQNTRIDDLIHWNYWLIAFIVAFFTLPSLAEGMKSFLKALASGVLAFFTNKRKGDKG